MFDFHCYLTYFIFSTVVKSSLTGESDEIYDTHSSIRFNEM